MTFLRNDHILIIKENKEIIPARFIESLGNEIAVNITGIGRVILNRFEHEIELDYQEKLIEYFKKSKKDNNYFKELYNYILPKF